MTVAMWACLATYWVAGARSIALGIRRYPVFTAFLILMNAIRGMWFYLDPEAYRNWWSTSSMVSNAFQIAVTIEAYLILANQVRNFGWKWRVLAVLTLPGVFVGGVLAIDNGVAYQAAMYFTQVAGFGLGIAAMLGAGLSSAIPIGFSRNSRIHAGVISVMWLSSGLGYLLYHSHWSGWWILTCVPAIACLVWSSLMTNAGEMRPPGPTDQEFEDAANRAKEAERLARGLRLPFFRD